MSTKSSADASCGVLLWVACVISRADPDLAAESNAFDRGTIVANAALLCVVTLLALIVWTLFFATFMPLWVAFALALVFSSAIFLIDQQMVAADWHLAGMLRSDDQPVAWSTRLHGLFRIGMRFAVGNTPP